MQQPTRARSQASQDSLTGGPGIAVALLGLALLAALVRWVAYTGFFGSDEVTYIASAFKVLDGDWKLDDYVGANRLGVNLPLAGFAAVFGRNEFGAALYSLASSVAEVLLVTWVGWRVFGLRAGVFAGLLMATLPTHVHIAGRILADPPLTLALTASFVLFIEAELRGWSMGFFLAGVAAGLSFLVKPVTLFVFAILFVYPLVERRFDRRWLWMGAGFVITMAFNGLLYMAITGRFWYVFESILARRESGYLEAGAAAGEILSSPWIYPVYLFGKIYHTGLIGFLAAAGALMLLFGRGTAGAAGGMGTGPRYIVLWAVGLLLIMSLLPVGFSPLLFMPKQTNYMLIFVAPLCVLGGYALATMAARWSVPVALLAALVGIAFALMLQASVAVFTANSQATWAYVQARPDTTFHVMSNAYRAAQFKALMGEQDLTPRMADVAALKSPSADERIALIDAESFDWDLSRPFASADAVPACWVATETLVGQPRGLGAALLPRAALGVRAVPGLANSGVGQALLRRSEPRPVRIYRVPAGC